MTISVIIPTLNEEDNIGVLLTALRQQTLRPEEVIVVDAGSSDETLARARSFPEVTVLTAAPPVGAQRQLGLERSGGDWCVFLDADTRPSPGFLERCLRSLTRRRLDIGCPFYWPGGSTPPIRAVYGVFNAIFALLQWVLPSGAGSGIVVRRTTALAAGGFRPGFTYDDLEFIRRAARRGRFRMLPAVLEVSDRRFRQEGVLVLLGKYLLLSVFFTFNLFGAANRVPYRFGHYRQPEDEQVVLVDDQDQPIGTSSKSRVHTGATPLHRAFSVFLFNKRGQLLVQQRSHTKKTWPLVWSNSCCGHPAPGESREEAARRRLKDELGIGEADLRLALPGYRYRAEFRGVVENEICPVFVAVTGAEPRINPREVEAIRWVDWDEFVRQVRDTPGSLAVWCVEEALLLEEAGVVQRLLAETEHSRPR